MNKKQLSTFLRDIRFMHLADKVRFYQQKNKNRKANNEFKINNPQVNLPPDYLIYESHEMNYNKYYNGGEKTAKWLMDHLNNYVDLMDKKILDWGCGPGRIIRHLPKILNNNCELYGTDYNKKSIVWNTENLTKINFNHNSLQASLPYDDGFMDIIYGLSIFTHLSEKLHDDWYAELYRILKPGGIMFLTTAGDNYKGLLTKPELVNYNKNKLVTRGKVKEGHRIYTAFHPKKFMKNLFQNAKILNHIETPPQEGWIPQDIWIVQKPI